MFVLDTNHVSELTYRTTAGSRLLQRLDAADQRAYVTRFAGSNERHLMLYDSVHLFGHEHWSDHDALIAFGLLESAVWAHIPDSGSWWTQSTNPVFVTYITESTAYDLRRNSSGIGILLDNKRTLTPAEKLAFQTL